MGYADELGIALGEAARAWRFSLDRRLKPLGLSRAKWLVLLHLSRDGDGPVQKELATRLCIEGPTLVGLLDRMSRDGWIERRPYGSDRRSKTVHMTDKARRIIPCIDKAAETLRGELLSSIPESDLRHCIKVLELIKERAGPSEPPQSG